jgi:flagellar biosynthetic protein FliQ
MTESEILDVLRTAFLTALTLALPLLVVSLAVGLTISIFQAATQIQEQTMTFVPKLIVVGLVLVLLAPLMMATMREYMVEHFRNVLNFM